MNCFLAHSSVILVFRNSGNKHQNNPLLSAETVRHSSAYIILYVILYSMIVTKLTSGENSWHFQMHFLKWEMVY